MRDPQHAPADNCHTFPPPGPYPPAVSSWVQTAGWELLNPKTIELPPPVFSWYTASASTFYAGCTNIPAVVETPTVTPSAPVPPITAAAASTPNLTSTDSTPNGHSSLPSLSRRFGTNFHIREWNTDRARCPDRLLPTSPTPDPNNTPAAPSPSASLNVPNAPITATSTHHRSNKTAGIVAGVLVPLLLLALCATAFIIHKRRRRARDRREWERTHAEIADAVREMHGEVPSAVAPWSMARVDVKAPPDYGGGEKAALFDKHGGEVLSARSSTSI
ncbi:hypothetical protein R3P38DRAFT_3193830 [Favolaschia claudopus]|uniref:Uncharacterized protein n=1 Tax=Favolaschia claudopus TaxID=2862362 RepID=A0AAW0BFH0_9AGAR